MEQGGTKLKKPCHADSTHNLFGLIAGSKQLTVAPANSIKTETPAPVIINLPAASVSIIASSNSQRYSKNFYKSGFCYF
jgi:hypothetical protein